MPPRTSNQADPADAPAEPRQALRVAVLADSDTRWKWGALTARRLTAEVAGDGRDARPVEV
ncbi:hypothetical protein ABZ943_40425, partial [Streptomyces rubiginosohelvolus]